MVSKPTIDEALLLVIHPRVLSQLNREGEHVALVEHFQALLKRLLVVSVSLRIPLACMAESSKFGSRTFPSSVIVNKSPHTSKMNRTGEMSVSVWATTRRSGSRRTKVHALNRPSAVAEPNLLRKASGSLLLLTDDGPATAM